jgi:hypothetical protein
MPGEPEGSPTGPLVTQGDIEEPLERLQNMIQACLDDFDPEHYRDAYRKIAFSGTYGAAKALEKQRPGGSGSSGDPVNVFRFTTDTWFNSAVHAWEGMCDLTNQYLQDLSNYAGRYPTTPAPDEGDSEPAPDGGSKREKPPKK